MGRISNASVSRAQGIYGGEDKERNQKKHFGGKQEKQTPNALADHGPEGRYRKEDDGCA